MTPSRANSHVRTGSRVPTPRDGLGTTLRGVVQRRAEFETEANTSEARPEGGSGYVQGREGYRRQGSDTDPGSPDRAVLFPEHHYLGAVARSPAVRRLRLFDRWLAQVHHACLDGRLWRGHSGLLEECA